MTVVAEAKSTGTLPRPSATLAARLVRRLPLIAWLVIVALSLAEFGIIAVTLDRPAPDQWGFRGFEGILAISFGSVGALIATRRPENRIGWLLLGFNLVAGVQAIVNQYPVLAAAATPALPGAELSRWISAWIWVIPSVGLTAGLALFFPTGRLLSRRWRWALYLAVVASVVQVGNIILATRPIGPVPPTANPVPYFAQVGLPIMLSYLLQLIASVVAVLSAVIRYRRSTGEERQQLKWVAYTAALLPFAAAGGFSGIFLGEVALIIVAALAACTIAIAILRYRLYEIDLIINRTLVYGALSAILAGVYTASITLSQRLFMAITGEKSDAAIVLTTLVVAATFTPVKTRLQAIVDARLKPALAPGSQPTDPTLAAAASSATPMPALDVLARLALLHESGGLTTAEYRRSKARLLPQILDGRADTTPGS